MMHIKDFAMSNQRSFSSDSSIFDEILDKLDELPPVDQDMIVELIRNRCR